MRALFLFTFVAGGLAHADTVVHKLTLDQVMTKALAGPKVRIAVADQRLAEARVAEADAARYPRAKLAGFGTASPRIHCLDAACTTTDPTDFAFKYQGVYAGVQLEIVQPLYTFGKIDGVRRAAQAGLAAQASMVDEAAGDLAVDAATAYYGAKLSRELVGMLDDGIERIEKVVDSLAKRTGADAPTIQDRQRVAVLLAEARSQRADAAGALAQSLAGLRAVVGDDDADVDDAPLVAVEVPIPTTIDASARPQVLAARKAARAADEIVATAHAYLLPDISLIGTALAAGAQGADNPPSIYAYDPYNRTSAMLVVNVAWTFEPWRGAALKDKVDADAAKAHAVADLAAAGARYDAAKALADLTAARAKVDSAKDGEVASHTWLASVLQNEALGLVESKDFADAYIAYFQMHARWVQALFQYDVAAVRLRRATGECRVDHRCDR